MRRSRTSRWMSAMLRKMERFLRISAWAGSPRMRFVLRQSPVHWMHERLWLIERLEPRLRVVNRNLSNTYLFSFATAAATATKVIHRSSAILRRLPGAAPQSVSLPAPPMRYDRADAGRAPASHAGLAPAPPLMTVPLPLPRRENAPPWLEAPLVARLGQRAKRVDDIPLDLPARLVRAPAAAVPPVAAQGFTGPHNSPAAGFPRPVGTTPWPVAPAPAAPVNVQQLTSEVLRQLDRRLIASRERMGRI
jgi:hypothetical protein